MNERKTAAPVAPDGGVDALILAGLEAHKAGRLEEADRLYAQALRLQPNHVDALNLAGTLAFTRGQTDAAIKLIGKAIRAHPQHLDAYLNLAEALEADGRFAEAIETCQKVLVLQPDFLDAHLRLAALTAQAGAAPLALAHSRVALALSPESVEGLRAQGLALRRLARFPEAEAVYRRAVALAPRDVASLAGLAALLNETDFTAEAMDLYRQALAIDPEAVNLLIALGDVVERSGDAAAALVHFERALKLAPGAVEAMYRRACCLRDSGEFDLAEAGFKQAVAADPNHAASLLALVRLKRLDGGPAQQKHLARLTSEASRPGRDRVQAGFALGELLDRAGEPDAAFRRFTEANSAYQKMRAAFGERFDRAELRGQVDLIIDRLALEYDRDTAGWGNPSEMPVFVVGLPRSGTTLVEQIAASHSQVHGAGELRAIMLAGKAIVGHNEGRGDIRNWDAAFARTEADKHALDLERLGGGALRVVDKAPLNLMRLGLIGALFPNARVIWCRRDPRDVVVSNHTMYYAQGNLWSTDQADCAYAVRQIERLGEGSRRVSKLPILEVVYEDLVADLDSHVRRIIDFLGVDWEPACLDFHNTDRHVTTPSAWQVRQPIYSSSVGRWRRYERHLGPMLATLAASD